MPPVQYHLGKFPPKNLEFERLLPLIESASSAVAGYEGALAGIPNSDVLLSPLTTQEAVLSSRIEGTQATMGEVLEHEAGVAAQSEAKRIDIQEIVNSRSATRAAVELMEKYSLSLRVIKDTHRVLMQGVRGKNKAPGEFRKTPVHIGSDKNVENARFVPISAGELPSAISE
jgi:Fic family protein